jgi:EAL domain-containing protein (putative c-di-GMP-specific phosphodiesterase class I)
LQYKPVFDVIKIDPSVVADIETNRDCRQPAALSRGSAQEHLAA